MLDLIRSTRLLLALLIAAVGSTVMYCNHVNRAVNDCRLCRDVEKHVVKLNTDANGAVVSDPDGLVDNIRDTCERFLSKSQAKCILQARTNAEVKACR